MLRSVYLVPRLNFLFLVPTLGIGGGGATGGVDESKKGMAEMIARHLPRRFRSRKCICYSSIAAADTNVCGLPLAYFTFCA